MIGIYKITSPSGKIYIGQSKDIEKRFKAYKNLKCKGQPYIYRSLLKYGSGNHLFEVVEECEIDILNIKERFWQDYYNSVGVNGLNCMLTNAGDKTGGHSEETKRKLSEISKINVKGRKHSQQTKDKIGFAHKGNKHGLGKKMPENLKKKLIGINIGNKYFLGKKHSKETLLKMSEIKKGNKYCLGRIMDNDIRYKIKKSNTGKKRTKESKLKISLARRKLILNTNTGVFYLGIQEACDSAGLKKHILGSRLSGKTKNDTSFIYV